MLLERASLDVLYAGMAEIISFTHDRVERTKQRPRCDKCGGRLFLCAAETLTYAARTSERNL